MKKLIAVVNEITLPPIEGPGPFGNIGQAGKAGTNFGKIVSSVFKVIILVAVLWSFLQIILGGLSWINSKGDAQAVESARNRIVYGIIGFIVVLSAWGLIVLMEKMLGTCLGFSCSVDLRNLAP